MPRGISALLLHTLHSQYRGPRILNMAGEPTPPAPTPPEPTPPATPPAAPAPATPPKPEDHEGRITELNTKLKEAKAKLKEYEDGEAKKRGEHEKLLTEREAELATLRGDHESKAKALEAYEKAAKEQVDKKLEGIKDEKKKASLLKLLDGRPVLEQFALIDEAISLAGGSSDFGGATPAGGDVPKDAKKKRYAELLAKPDLTPSERAESRKLMVELSEYANADKGAFDTAK